MKKFILLSFFIYNQSLFAQKDSIPLIDFFQRNYDSTIIISIKSGCWEDTPNYYILSKSNNIVNSYKYCNIFAAGNLRQKFPTSVAEFYLKQSLNFSSIPPDSNVYLLPFNEVKNSRSLSWDSVSLINNAWKMFTDSSEYYGCLDIKGIRHDVYHHYTYTFYLITKHKVSSVSFYAPEEYESMCTGNVSRQAAIRILNIFRNLFGKTKREL